VLQPHVRRNNALDAAPWADALVAVKSAVDAAGGPASTRFFASAHASLEELFMLRQISGKTGGVTIGWKVREKPQPANTKFKIPAVDAPNVRGARDLGFNVGAAIVDRPAMPEGVAGLRSAVDAGQVKVLYVFDPGPDNSLGEAEWILAARKAGKIKTLIVQGALQTALADAADILLPGAAWMEKDATYTNMTGHVQAASRVIMPPGEAGEDWQVLMKLGVVFGANVSFASAAAVRDTIARELSALRGYAALPAMSFSRPVSAQDWLQTSNPSERWKWDFMFQDLPPVKFGDDFGPLPRADVIPLKEVK